MVFFFFFTNFDSVYVRFDLSLFTFRLLNFVIDIPSYLGASSWMNWIVNKDGCWVPLLLNFVTEFPIIDKRMLKIVTFVFIVTRRLKKHYILKFICFKLLGHCNIFTVFLVSFCISWLSLCVGYSIDHVYISLAFDFWHVSFGIRYLAFVFWHLLFGIHCLF